MGHKLSYFPLMIDRWIAGTQELSFEERGYYISLLVWLYDSGKAIKDSDHAARILRCDKRTSRRLLGKLRPKFRLTSAGLRHRLCDELLRNGGKVKNLRVINSPPIPDPDPDLDLSLPSFPSQDSCSESMEEKALVASEKLATPDSPKNGRRQKKIPDCPHQEIISLYHEHCPHMPEVRNWPEHRKKLLKARWSEHPGLNWWTGYLKFANESPFLNGDNDRGWRADLEWLIRPTNFCKVTEGKYHGR